MPVESEWSKTPPSWALPVTVAGELVLLRTEQMLVYIGPVCAYPVGFVFCLTVGLNPRSEPRMTFGIGPGGPVRRLQVRFDGWVADSAARRPVGEVRGEPVLWDCGWRSTGDRHPNPRHVSRWWVSPLPEAGPVEFAVFVDGSEEASGTAQMDAGQITGAASRSVALWAGPGREPEPR